MTTDALWLQAWCTLSKKQQEAAPRVAIIEVTPHGEVCKYTLHNVDGTGLPVAEARAAALIEKTGKQYVVREIAGAK